MKTFSISARLGFLIFAALFCVLPSRGRAQTASQFYADASQSYNAGDVAEAKRKLQLTLEIDKNFRPASILLNRINLAEQAARGSSVGTAAMPVSVKTLEQVTFPVEFKNTSLETALEFIRQQVETASGGKTQINFVLQLPPELANKKVSLQLNHVPVTELLRYLGDLAGVSFQLQKYAIVVVPLTAPKSSEVPGTPTSRP